MLLKSLLVWFQKLNYDKLYNVQCQLKIVSFNACWHWWALLLLLFSLPLLGLLCLMSVRSKCQCHLQTFVWISICFGFCPLSLCPLFLWISSCKNPWHCCLKKNFKTCSSWIVQQFGFGLTLTRSKQRAALYTRSSFWNLDALIIKLATDIG